MDEIEKLIEKKCVEVKETTAKELRELVAHAEGELEAYEKHLKECAKIVLPVNILDILSNGGEVVSGIVGVGAGDNVLYAGNELHMVYGSEYIFHSQSPHTSPRKPIILRQGKYRITVIVEKLESADPTSVPAKEG